MPRTNPSAYRQIRANYDRNSIVVYQAYRDAIAKPALSAGKFVEPYSWQRMTWIKPSFLWMMARSNWATKSGQENVLAVRVSRTGWDNALSLATLTSYEPGIHENEAAWRNVFESAPVHVQWDPERSIHNKKLEHRAIQVGISRHLIRQLTDQWIIEINDVTPLVKKIRTLSLAGHHRRAKDLLPSERVYPTSSDAAKKLGVS